MEVFFSVYAILQKIAIPCFVTILLISGAEGCYFTDFGVYYKIGNG